MLRNKIDTRCLIKVKCGRGTGSCRWIDVSGGRGGMSDEYEAQHGAGVGGL